MSSSRVTHFFKASDKSLILAAKEATSAYHAVIHGQSFESSDCTCGGQKMAPHVNNWSPLDGAHE